MADQIYVVTIHKYPKGQKPPWLTKKRAGDQSYQTQARGVGHVRTFAGIIAVENEATLLTDINTAVVSNLNGSP